MMFNNSEYYRLLFSVNVWRCVNETRQHEIAVKTENAPSWTWTSVAEHYVRKYGGDGWAEMFQCLFCSGNNKTDSSIIMDETGCGQKDEWRAEVDLYPVLVLYWTFLAIFSVFVILLIWHVVKIALRFQWKKFFSFYSKTQVSQHQNGEIATINKEMPVENPETQISTENTKTVPSASASVPENLLASQRYLKRDSYRYCICPTVSDVSWFLKNTVDFFFLELDKFLICQNIPSNIPVLRRQNTVSSPRLDSNRIRRNRTGSSPALSGLADGDEMEKKSAIKEFQEVLRKSRSPFYCDVDEGMIHNYGGNVKTLLQYYVESCSVRYDQWYVASLIVNYTLSLLEKELETIGSMHGVRFVKFATTGSIRKGSKCYPVNQFDIHMVLQGVDFNPYKFIDQNVCDVVPPGKLILCAKQTQSARAPWVSKCLKSLPLNGEKCCCISALEVLSVSEELVDRALQRLYTETRSLIDRLPFKVQRSATPDLTLSIETKNLIGLNLPEIKIRIVPSVPVSINSWLHPIQVYAVPPWVNIDYKRKSGPNTCDANSQLGKSDVIWSLSLGDLESFYLEKIDQRMEMAGIHSCHRICLSILKSLFTQITKKSLLDRGEVSSYVLETIVYHLLLESSPQLWNFDRLQDRVSDCVLFLEAALQNCRLPNFFVNNLYLVKQMPVIETWSFLSKGRQENLLSDFGNDSVEKTRHYIASRLDETGLKSCINDVYSPEMWEYEFFLF